MCLDKIELAFLINQTVENISITPNLNLLFSNGSINVECSWRIRCEYIVLGSGESETTSKVDYVQQALEKYLYKRKIVGVDWYGEPSDLKIKFEGNVILELFHDSSLYEAWQLSGPNNFLMVATPGGMSTIFKSKED